jgi:hypothetical protein
VHGLVARYFCCINPGIYTFLIAFFSHSGGGKSVSASGSTEESKESLAAHAKKEMKIKILMGQQKVTRDETFLIKQMPTKQVCCSYLYALQRKK